jgi:hypothetical protein
VGVAGAHLQELLEQVVLAVVVTQLTAIQTELLELPILVVVVAVTAHQQAHLLLVLEAMAALAL